MTVTVQIPSNRYAYAGSSTFVYSFLLLSSGDLEVQVDGVTKTLGIDYTVSGVGSPSGGTITYLGTLTTGQIVTLARETAQNRSVDYQPNGDLKAVDLNADLDRLVMMVQEVARDAALRAIKLPIGEVATDLPTATDRANKLLSFDALGQPAVTLLADQSATALQVALASTTAGQGAALVGSNDAGGYFTGTTAEAQLQQLGRQQWYEDFWGHFSDAQKADILAYTYTLDCRAALQEALDAAFAAGRSVLQPAGGYRVNDSLVMPGSSTTRGKPFIWRGAGTGEPFVITNLGGTVIKGTHATNPTLKYVQDVAVTGNGQADISYIRFTATNTTAVIDWESFFATSEFHHNVVHQLGTGNGVECTWAATVELHNNYAFNGGAFTAVLGAARTGIGFYMHNDHDAGLVTLRKNTSRGWLTPYQIGDGTTANIFKGHITECEASTCYNGIILTSKAQYWTVANNYMEGLDGGTGITDQGNFNDIINNLMFAGFAIGIDLQSSGYGGVCAFNKIASSTRANTTFINCVLSVGLGRTVTRNTIIWGSSGGAIAGVSGITLSGANGQIDLSGNVFNPKINWVGGAGSQQITDNTTSTLSAGNGQYGFGTASFDNLQIPLLNQGAVSLAKGATAITTVTAGVCSLSAASSHLITFAGATNITSFTSGLIEGKFFVVRVTNANCTFVNGANLKMAGAVNYTPGANGASVVFLMHSNVAWEICRTAY
jgi:hypothetical protein